MLKKTIKNGMLCTNLINGGKGSTIFTSPLIQLVKDHINPGWEKTHFLSFTESEERAMGFGAFGIENYNYDNEDNWNFALIKFYPPKLKYQLVEEGVYRGSYKQSLIAFPNGCWVVLIDTVKYLKANIHLNTTSQLKNAMRDKEWLILPATPTILNFNMVEYDARLDMSDVMDYELH